MSTLSLYVGLADANGRPFDTATAGRLIDAVADALSTIGASTLAAGTLHGADENGTAEPSWHALVAVPATASHLALFRSLASIVAATGQRSFGVVGWHPVSTVVPADAYGHGAAAWHVDAVERGQGRHAGRPILTTGGHGA